MEAARSLAAAAQSMLPAARGSEPEESRTRDVKYVAAEAGEARSDEGEREDTAAGGGAGVAAVARGARAARGRLYPGDGRRARGRA